MKDIPLFNEGFHKILLSSPTITVEEQLVRYARSLKIYIRKEKRNKECNSLVELVPDTERTKIAHHRFSRSNSKLRTSEKIINSKDSEPVPMQFGNH